MQWFTHRVKRIAAIKINVWVLGQEELGIWIDVQGCEWREGICKEIIPISISTDWIIGEKMCWI